MGILTVGNPLTWSEIDKILITYRKWCQDDLCQQYQRVKLNRAVSGWLGEEVEYCLVPVNNRTSFPGIQQLIDSLNRHDDIYHNTNWNPEYSKLMIEGVTKRPYSSLTETIANMEVNLQWRRQRLACHFPGWIPTLSFPPFLGNDDDMLPYMTNPVSQSEQVSDSVIFSHPRFPVLTKNIRDRRGSRIKIQCPIYQDTSTKITTCSMDCMAYGMGSCCLQVTYQASGLPEALRMFDIMMVLTPIMLSVTAASPIYQGKIVDTDTRWSVISQSVDDRTVLETYQNRLPSRYSTSMSYLSNGGEDYNDYPVLYDKQAFNRLLSEGMDPLLATHFAHILLRNPLIVYESQVTNPLDTNWFQMLQSTVWQDVRLKIPTDQDDSWKMEFRPMEIQLTDYENTSAILFSTIYLRMCLWEGSDYRIPITNLLQNVQRAHQRNSYQTQHFWWSVLGKPRLLTLREIFLDSEHGIWVRMERYVEQEMLEPALKLKLLGYLRLIINRIDGHQPTNATQIRNYVMQHPKYERDSKVSLEIMNDLVKKYHYIGLVSQVEILPTRT